MHGAARGGRNKDILWLLDRGADINAVEVSWVTALWLAAKAGHEDSVRLLLERGADPYKSDMSCCMALGGPLCSPKQNETVKGILFKEAKHAKVADPQGREALHFATFEQPRAVANGVVNALIEAGWPVNGRDRDGWAPLHWAAHHRTVSSIMALIDAGADRTAKSRDGSTPYHIALTHNVASYVCKALRPALGDELLPCDVEKQAEYCQQSRKDLATTGSASTSYLGPERQSNHAHNNPYDIHWSPVLHDTIMNPEFEHSARCDDCYAVGDPRPLLSRNVLIRSRSSMGCVTDALSAEISTFAPSVIHMLRRPIQTMGFAVWKARTPRRNDLLQEHQ